MKDSMWIRRALAGGLLAALAVSCAHRRTDTVMLLHTNDIHGHIRAGTDGIGGMAYVGSYIREVKAKRPDTLVLDGGDINNKGDMLSGVTKGRALYEVMGMIGYDAGVPGNHDFVYGMEHLQDLAHWGSFPLLCLNALDEAGRAVLPGSQVFEVDGVKVGIIGVTIQRGAGTLTLKDTFPLLAREAERLEPEVHLLVALCHLSSKECGELSRAVPSIDVFVGGHAHEALQKPIIVEETGAIMIEAGDCARYVGRLKIKVDLDSEEVVGHRGRLVSIKHKRVSADPELRAWIARQEREICPQVAEIVGRCKQEVMRSGMARLLAAALLDTGEAEVALARIGVFCRGLPAGTITYNALYRTFRLGEQRAVVVELSGQDILTYLEKAPRVSDVPQWAGFTADMAFPDPEKSGKVVATSLDPNRIYRVVLPEDEAHGLLLGIGAEGRKATLTPCAFTVSEVLLPYVARLGQGGKTLDDVAVPEPTRAVQSAGQPA